MSVLTETRNLDIYGSAELPWSRASALLDTQPAGPGVPFFLSTVGPGGRPHSAGIGPMWHEGDLFFATGLTTRKARNLAANPACTIAAHLRDLDLVLEGEARREDEPATLEAVAALFRAGGWPAIVEDGALTAPYSAPSAGPPPWHLHRFTFHTAFGVATAEPSGATRWRFR